jgi:hypothetical protein
MSVIPRLDDPITELHAQLGLPFLQFAPQLPSGAFGPFRNLGIVDNAEIAKELNNVELPSFHSGVDVLVRELVQRFRGTINVGVLNFEPANMQLALASASLTNVGAATVTIADDSFVLTDDNQDFLELDNQLVTEQVTAVTCGQITDESVGTATAAADGDTLGDFTLDFKPLDHLDVTKIVVTDGVTGVATEYSTTGTGDIIGLGAAVAGLEVEVEDFLDDATNAGRLRFNSGGAPTALSVGSTVTATYKPSHTFTENTDFVVDYKAGRVRMGLNDLRFNPDTEPNALELKSFQPMEADYDHTEFDHGLINPFTQFVFPGKAQLLLLPDIGINIVWPIPKVSVRLTDDSFTFSKDTPGVLQLAVQLLNNGGVNPYGSAMIYEETP